MEQPYFSEAQSSISTVAAAERPGDHFSEPEDPQSGSGTETPADTSHRTEQPGHPHGATRSAEFATAAGTVRPGMTVIDSYGHAIGIVSSVDGERLRLASTDPHDDGVAFLPVGLIDGIDGDRVLLGGRGDASFGMSED